MNVSVSLEIWIGALLTLMVFSLLFQDNPFYRFAESLFIGASAGWALSVAVNNVLIPRLFLPLAEGELLHIIPLILGLMFISGFTGSFGAAARWPLALIIGVYAALNAVFYTKAYLLDQITASMGALLVLTADRSVDWPATANAWIMFAGTVSVLIHFSYTRKERGIGAGIGRIGVGYLMIAFGAVFSYTVAARITQLIGRFDFLLNEWLGLLK